MIRMGKKEVMNIHSKCIDELSLRLLRGTIPIDTVSVRHKYTFNGKEGEIDYLVFTETKYLLQFEVKSHDSVRSRSKAYSQLYHALAYIKDQYHPKRIFQFYYSPRRIKWVNYGNSML